MPNACVCKYRHETSILNQHEHQNEAMGSTDHPRLSFAQPPSGPPRPAPRPNNLSIGRLRRCVPESNSLRLYILVIPW